MDWKQISLVSDEWFVHMSMSSSYNLSINYINLFCALINTSLLLGGGVEGAIFFYFLMEMSDCSIVPF